MDNDNYIAFRFRSDDGVHQRGDIQYCDSQSIYIGQTQSCQLQLPKHPDFADTCYAVIVSDENGENQRIIRQETEADIRINGLSLELVQYLTNGDRLAFDHTEVEFTKEHGFTPTVTYVKRSNNKSVWAAFIALALIIMGMVWYLSQQRKSVYNLYKPEIESIYRIEADTLLVLTPQNDTIDILSLPAADIGTGFVTTDGFFVTARHCIEFWMAHEQELMPSMLDITSEIVKKAIESETDSTIRLVAKLRIANRNGIILSCTSDDFIMDKSRDQLYEYGDFETSYYWRSVVSHYELRDAELGDVAVMKWGNTPGKIHLASPTEIMNIKKDEMVYGFGYPQNNNEQKANLTQQDGRIFHFPEDNERCFTCDKSFDHGFSGCPIFVSTMANTHKVVIGIVTRSDDSHTLIVPVSQIHHLIEKANCHE